MELSIGDKVRVYFYPPKTTHSFVEGTVERNDVKTFDGLCFSLLTAREVILGHEVQTPRTLPYIIAYEKEDDFEDRIQVLEPAVRAGPDPIIAAEPSAEPEHGTGREPEIAAESEPALDTRVEMELRPQTPDRGWRRLFNRAV